MAIMHTCCGVIDILENYPIAIVTLGAVAQVAAISIRANCMLVALILSCDALIDIIAKLTAPIVTNVARALICM